jgi:hypothetical protein
MDYHTSSRKNYGQFLHEGTIYGQFYPHQKNTRNFFCYLGMTIHTPIESPGRVDKKYVVLKNVIEKIATF